MSGTETDLLVGLNTIDCSVNTLPASYVITIDDNARVETTDEQDQIYTVIDGVGNRLVHSFVWDLAGTTMNDEANLPYIKVIPQGQNESTTIYNRDFYKSPEEVKFSTVILPKGFKGMFTYYFGTQAKVYQEETEKEKMASVTQVTSQDEPLTVKLAQDYLEIASIRLEPEANNCYAYLEGKRIDFYDKNIRVYYNPDIFAGDLVLSHSLKAYIYGIPYVKELDDK